MTYSLMSWTASLSLVLTACSKAEGPRLIEATAGPFFRGQVWTFHTRPGDEAARVVVGRVDSLLSGELIIHVAITGLRLRNPHVAGGLQTLIPHAPLSRAAFVQSIVSRSNEPADLTGFEEGYTAWREAFDAGQAGFFDVPLGDIPGVVERTIATGPT